MKPPALSNLELLHAWTAHGDRESVGEIVRRHIDFVQAIARRCPGVDAHLAEDITQAVFILLLRKADRIRSDAALTSWLYTSARFAAANATKMIRRQKHREGLRASAAADATLEQQGERAVEESDMQRLLQEAMDQLPRNERLGVIMSYLQEKTHDQVASAMGVSPDAARKRIYRGVERMRAFLMAKGVLVPAATIAAVLAIRSSPVSAAVVESTANVAVLAQGPGAATVASVIAKGAAHMLFATKVKAVAAAVVATTLLGLAAGGAITILAQAPGTGTPTVAPLPVAAANPQVSDDVKVDFIGLGPIQGQVWHDFDGKAIDAPKVPVNREGLSPPPTHQALVRVTAPQNTDVMISIMGAGGLISVDEQDDHYFAFNTRWGADAVDFVVTAANGPWKSLFRSSANLQSIMSTERLGSSAIFFPLVAQGGGSVIHITLSQKRDPASGMQDQWRLICTDKQGITHPGKMTNGGASGEMEARIYSFDVPPDQIATVAVQTRPYHIAVTAKHAPLETGGPAAEIVRSSKPAQPMP